MVIRQTASVYKIWKSSRNVLVFVLVLVQQARGEYEYCTYGWRGYYECWLGGCTTATGEGAFLARVLPKHRIMPACVEPRHAYKASSNRKKSPGRIASTYCIAAFTLAVVT